MPASSLAVFLRCFSWFSGKIEASPAKWGLCFFVRHPPASSSISRPDLVGRTASKHLETGSQSDAARLRKCAARRCTEAGATEHQLMALFGCRSPKQAARYTQNVSRRRLEAAAAPLLVQGQKGNEGVQPRKPVASSWTVGEKKT